MTSCSLTSYAMMSAASFSAAASAAILASSTALAVAVTCGVRPPPVSPSPAHSRAAARGQRRSSRVTRGTVCPTSALIGVRFAGRKHAGALRSYNTRAPSAATRRAHAGCGRSRPRGHRPRKDRPRRHRPQKRQPTKAPVRKAPARAGTGFGAYRLTVPEALTICWKAVGGFVCEHLPIAVLAATARMFSLYVPAPLIFAYAPVPPESLKVPCPVIVSRQVFGLMCAVLGPLCATLNEPLENTNVSTLLPVWSTPPAVNTPAAITLAVLEVADVLMIWNFSVPVTAADDAPAGTASHNATAAAAMTDPAAVAIEMIRFTVLPSHPETNGLVTTLTAKRGRGSSAPASGVLSSDFGGIADN